MRRRKTKRQFSYEAMDESVSDPYDKYKVDFFNVLMDQCIMSLNERFCQLQSFKQHFDFLFNIRGLSRINAVHSSISDSDKELRSKCEQLQSVLTKDELVTPVTVSQNLDSHLHDQDDGEEPDDAHAMIADYVNDTNTVRDIDAISLFDELKNLSNILPDNVTTPLEVLRFIHATRLHECVPNVSTALRILLTVPVTVASGERSFSKLKLIKTYLRSTMTQDRLNGLAMISIENDVAASLNYSNLLSAFASAKARKVNF